MNTSTKLELGQKTLANKRVEFFRAASRWVVEHPGFTALLTLMLVGALCVGQWWLSYQHAQDWDRNHPGQPVPFRFFDAFGWTLIIGTGIWLGLWKLGSKENKTPSTSRHTDWWRFEARERQRILEGRPISRRLLWGYALFALFGLALGVALALKLAAALGWQEELSSRGRSSLGIVLLVIFVPVLAARRIRDVLFLQDCDYFVGDHTKEIAQAVAEEERAEAEAEREYERKTITGWPAIVFAGGFFGGLFAAYRWLPEADGTTAFQGSVSGLIAGAATVYLSNTKPRGWLIWLGFALVAAGGFLVFTHETWHRPVQYALLGALWGAVVGVATTVLYLRKLRRDSEPKRRR
jgi:hypothetical protein